jgi:hypothetical protein
LLTEGHAERFEVGISTTKATKSAKRACEAESNEVRFLGCVRTINIKEG